MKSPVSLGFFMNTSSRNITIFVFAWLILNLFTAAYVELSSDEAYYWLYGHKLDWGYFDHPPLIAVFNSILDRNILHTELSVRLLSVLSLCGFFYYLFLLIKPQNSTIFILLCSSTVAVHVFGFTSLPDTPLLFFSTAFFYYYQSYVSSENKKNILALCLIIPLLFYTKYHAVLVLLFSLIAYPIVLKRKSFYFIFIISLVLYTPHIYWQITHDYPSIKYHFVERNASEFRWIFVWDYISNQFVFYGTFFIPLAVISIFKYSSRTVIIDRLLKINLIGFFLFFLWSSHKGFVEVNWTLPALSCILYFTYQFYLRSKWGARIITLGGCTSLFILLVLRLHLIFPFIKTPFLDRTNDFRGHKEFVDRIITKTNAMPMVVTRYQEAGLFSYYSNSLIPSINLNGRKNQFNSWNLFPSINGKPHYLLSDNLDSTEVFTKLDRKYTLGFHKRLPAFKGIEVESFTLSTTQLSFKIGEECLKYLDEKSPEHPTFIKIKIKSNKTERAFKLPISTIEKKANSMIFVDLEKSLEKDNYKVEILLYSANFGTWSESWRKEIEVK